MDNLFESVIKVKIPAVYTIEELIEFHEALIAESGIENGEIYTQITRGTADYGLAFPEMSVPQLTMTIVETDREVLAAKRESGVNIITTEDIKDEMIWTHPDNNLVHKNITRRLIKERLAPDIDMQVIEKAFDMEFVLKAEEAFLCGPRCEIMPVTKIDRKFIGSGVGKVVPQLQAAFKAFVERECPAK